MLQLNKVHHIAIICSDYQRSLDFYTRVVGCQVMAEHWREEQQSYLTKLSLNGDYVAGAAIVLKAVQSWARRYDNRFNQIVIVDTYGDYAKALDQLAK